MRSSKWALALVILAIGGVLVMKQASESRREKERALTAAAGAVADAPAPRLLAQTLPGSELGKCLKSGLPTLAEFGKGTCKVCQAMEPVLRKAAEDYAGKANIVSVELDEYAGLGQIFKIAAMPTQVFFDAKGKEVTRHMGGLSREEIDGQLAALGAKR